MEDYNESTRIRPLMLALAGSIPVVGNLVSAADQFFSAQVQKEQKDRLGFLIQEMEAGFEDFGGPIPIQRSDPVIHAAYITIEVVLRTRRREKIRSLARLLASGLVENPLISLENEHEDFLKILDDLSHREISILAILDKYEKTHPRPHDDDNEYLWTDQYWSDFESELCARLGFIVNEIPSALVRLSRSGLYEPLSGSYFSLDPSNRGKLTGTYRRIAGIARMDSTYFDTGRIV